LFSIRELQNIYPFNPHLVETPRCLPDRQAAI
jgi:hypothetical protein